MILCAKFEVPFKLKKKRILMIYLISKLAECNSLKLVSNELYCIFPSEALEM